MKSYDAIVIGSGQGGNPMAHKLADLGQKVALIEAQPQPPASSRPPRREPAQPS